MRKLTLSLAVLAALLPLNGNTLGLGELELNSALNQELDAEIEILSAAPEDAEQLIVKLADRDAFARADIDRPYVLQQLKFEVITKQGQSYVKVFTKKPIREPFLSFLLEIDWPEGRLLREYTLLLDPPVYTGGNAQSSPTQQADSGRPFIDPADAQSNAQSVTSQQDYARPAQSSYQAPQAQQSGVFEPPEESNAGGQVSYQPMAQYANVSGEYRVQQNDTLWSVANKFRPDSSVSVEQMMLALVRNNPEAFIKENIHGIKRGYILRMPDRAAITTIDRQSALAQVREQTSLWREYREAMTGAVPASAMESDSTTGAEGIVNEAADGQLSIVSASGEDGSEVAASGQDPKAQELSRLRSELALAQEALESEKLEKDNLKSRLAELEQRVQSVLEMDDSELAQLQQELQGEVAKAEEPAPVVEEMAPEVVEEAPVDDMLEEQPTLVDEPVTDGSEMADESMVEPAIEDGMAEEGAPSDEESVFVDEAGVEPEPTDAATDVSVQPTIAPPFVQTKPKSFIENLFDNPSMLAAIGGGISALLIGLILLLRRLRKGSSGEDEWSAADEEITSLDDVGESRVVEADETMGADAGLDDTVDATAEMQASNFDDTQIEAPDDHDDTVISLDNEPAAAEEEKDDVIAEADVYLAYGIYQQAEELLQNAIKQNPERDDYRMKLLETHFAGKNSDGFAALAEEVQPRKGSDRTYWERVVVMGRELPSHQLFSSESATTLPGLDTEDLIPKKPDTPDLDLGDADMDSADANDMGADLDLGLDDLDDSADKTQVLSAPLDLEAAEPEADELDLGAELDDIASGLDLSDEEAPADTASAEDEALEFDLGDFGEELEDTADAVADDAPEDTASALDIDEDFSLDFEASDLGFETADDQTESDASEPAQDDTGMNLDEDLDLGIDLEDADASAEIDLDMDTSDTALELDAGNDVELDLGDGLDLADDDVSLDLDDAAVTSLGDDDDDFDISELSEDVDEVSTKLDLARAYIDMGDNEGAKSILEEVKQEGNEQQQQQANELLQKAS